MATRKNTPTVSEFIQEMTSPPTGEFVNEVYPLSRVFLLHATDFTATGGLELGTEISNGPHNGGKVVGLYAVAMGFMIEIRMPSGDVETVLHRGDGAGVLA